MENRKPDLELRINKGDVETLRDDLRRLYKFKCMGIEKDFYECFKRDYNITRHDLEFNYNSFVSMNKLGKDYNLIGVKFEK